MKKVIVSFVLILGTSVLVSAQEVKKEECCKNQPVENVMDKVAEDDGFKVVEIAELPEKVQEAITKLSEESTVTATAWNAETKQAKVTVVCKSDDEEKTAIVLLDEEGNKVEQE